MTCLNCKNLNLKKIVSMGKQPLSGIFLNKKTYNLKKYPLDLHICKKCNLVQLKKYAKLELMYGSQYGYKTSISKLMIKHLKKKIPRLNRFYKIKKSTRILDIGSNDGSFLNLFKNTKNLFGIDPSCAKHKKNYKKYIHTISNFFSILNIEKYFKLKKINKLKFDLITSFAIFYDVKNPNKFCNEIYKLLSDNGIWMCEFSYLPLMLKNLTFDQICHEHLAYYNLSVFKKIIENNNLKVIDVSVNEINGGSIEVLCGKNNCKHNINKSKINKLLSDAKKITSTSYKNFSKRIKHSKDNLTGFIKNNKSKRFIGYGASTKGNVVLNHFKISNKSLPYICDGNKTKIKKYTPGGNIKIISKDRMRKLKPNYLIVLIWSFRSEIIKEEIDYIKKGGSLIFHLPRFHIINKLNNKKYIKKDFKDLSYSY